MTKDQIFHHYPEVYLAYKDKVLKFPESERKQREVSFFKEYLKRYSYFYSGHDQCISFFPSVNP